MAKDYLFKITPNNKNVVINSDVLLNGYPDVTYPITYKTGSNLGYVLDPETFKFVALDTLENIQRPYPVKIEIEPNFEKLPFYSVNYSVVNNIQYTTTITCDDDTAMLHPSDDGTYDEGTFYNSPYDSSHTYGHFDDGYISGFYAYYSIHIKLYWSDGKSHADEYKGNDNYWNSISDATNVYPLVLRIKRVGTDEVYYYPVDKYFYEAPEFDPIDDNFDMYEKEPVTFKIDVTFTDPYTFLSVYNVTSVTVLQEAYPGCKMGYIKLNFLDYKPLEIFSPIVTPIYARSKNENANVKVDEKLKTEYYGFLVTFHAKINTYNYIKTVKLVKDSVLDPSTEEPVPGFKTSNYMFNNFSVNVYTDNDILSNEVLLYLTDKVFLNTDYDNFKSIYDEYKQECDNKKYYSYTDKLYIPDYDTEFPKIYYDLELNAANSYGKVARRFYVKDDYESVIPTSMPTESTVLKIVTNQNVPISISDNERTINYGYSFLKAAYAKYYRDSDNNKYVQIKDESTYNSKADTYDIFDYAIENDSKNNSVQYKYCVNSLLNSNIQVPRYAVYPILEGYLKIPFKTYDFENPHSTESIIQDFCIDEEDLFRERVLVGSEEYDSEGSIVTNTDDDSLYYSFYDDDNNRYVKYDITDRTTKVYPTDNTYEDSDDYVYINDILSEGENKNESIINSEALKNRIIYKTIKLSNYYNAILRNYPTKENYIKYLPWTSEDGSYITWSEYLTGNYYTSSSSSSTSSSSCSGTTIEVTATINQNCNSSSSSSSISSNSEGSTSSGGSSSSTSNNTESGDDSDLLTAYFDFVNYETLITENNKHVGFSDDNLDMEKNLSVSASKTPIDYIRFKNNNVIVTSYRGTRLSGKYVYLNKTTAGDVRSALNPEDGCVIDFFVPDNYYIVSIDLTKKCDGCPPSCTLNPIGNYTGENGNYNVSCQKSSFIKLGNNDNVNKYIFYITVKYKKRSSSTSTADISNSSPLTAIFDLHSKSDLYTNVKLNLNNAKSASTNRYYIDNYLLTSGYVYLMPSVGFYNGNNITYYNETYYNTKVHEKLGGIEAGTYTILHFWVDNDTYEIVSIEFLTDEYDDTSYSWGVCYYDPLSEVSHNDNNLFTVTSHNISDVVLKNMPNEEGGNMFFIFTKVKVTYQQKTYSAKNYNISSSNLYSTSSATTNSCTISLTVPDTISNYLRINGVKGITSMTSVVPPNIFVLSMDEYPYNLQETLEFNVSCDGNTLNGTLLITNDENEKHLTKYDNDGKNINTTHSSSMLLRANPKLSGNIKLVVDTDYNLYLDTFKANDILSNKCYRKYPISVDGNYPRDIKKVFKNIPINKLFSVPSDSLKAHKVYHDFNNQYETMYEYGAETNTDRLYSENMKILAPLHIGNNIPEFFAIFRYSDIFNEETYNGAPILDTEKFKQLLSDSTVISVYNLRTHTSIGQYLNNYMNMVTNYGECYLQFIEQDYNQNSPYYRQGNNIWKGISVKRGLLVDQSETTYFGSKILNSDAPNKQELFNNYIIAGFEKHGLVYPNIINLEFMFNDNDMEEYSMHRYFGLYLTANEFIHYKYILPNSKTQNREFIKYDNNDNVYVGDNIIYNNIFTEKFNDRLFFAITNNKAGRIQSNSDLNSFITKNVINTPESNLLSIDSDVFEIDEEDKSFITMHFSKPLQYGEHIKLIALNYTDNATSYVNVGSIDSHSSNKLPYVNIVYEIIASNDERLLNTDNNISPYVNTLKCRYSENTYFYRLAFYSQDLDYQNVTATIEEQIKRIIQCIIKFDTFLYVSNHTKNTLSIVSKYDEMYLQHINAHDFNDFKYDYFELSDITSPLYTTNKDYTSSIDFMPHTSIEYVDKYEQIADEEHDWLNNAHEGDWFSYVEAEDPDNIIKDSISYFNSNITYYMHALTNQSDYFDNYYTAFSNYGFETVGWRYNNIVQFQKFDNDNYVYTLYKNVQNLVNNVKYPLIYNNAKIYDSVNLFNINSGYLRNNVLDPDIYTNYITTQQEFKFTEYNPCVIASPYNTDYCLISAKNDSLLTNNKINLYNPTLLSIDIMGISNIKDIYTTVDYENTIHHETNLTVSVNAGESIATDESDYRIQYGVVYEVVEGTIQFGSYNLKPGNLFIFTADNLYTNVYSSIVNNSTLTMKTNVKYKVSDRLYYQDYKYDSIIPTLNTDNYFADINDKNNSDLIYPIVPSVNCLWKSNGEYYDNNSILDVSLLNSNYEYNGYFPENVYTPSDYDVNQYISNKIDNILYVDEDYLTYKDCILNNSIRSSIYKFLVDNKNVETASVYYNSNIKSLEFIFSGIKFNIKLNTKQVNTYIHLEDYDGFEAFVINDYDLSKKNELYISIKEKFILLINHLFYVTYAHEAANNVKCISSSDFKAYADYSVFNAVYDIDFSSTAILSKNISTHKKNNLHKLLMSQIDKYNLWSSLFVQYDTPTIESSDDNEPLFIQFMLESINEYDDYDYVSIALLPYGIGLLDTNIANADSDINSIYSDSNSFIITKADGDYNTHAIKLLTNFNNVIETAVKNGCQTCSLEEIQISTSELSFMREITADEEKLNKSVSENVYTSLSNILNSDSFRVLYTISKVDEEYNISKDIKGYNSISFDSNELKNLQSYIESVIALESPYEKLERYVKSFTDDVDIYIIPEDDSYKYVNNTIDNNPLIFTLSIPNSVKYNYGWFTPYMNNMLDFYVDDELKDILNVDLMLSNTNVNELSRLINYTGNKVYEDSVLQTVKKNYYIEDSRSLLSSTWDYDYYRLYTDEDNYQYTLGYKTGIDDKSFFGSRCMILYHEYILLNTWEFTTANDLLTVKTVDSKHNVSSSNIKNKEVKINLSNAFYNHFINNEVFAENWNYFNDALYTGMKNYVNNTLSTYYNINSDIEVVLYAIDTDPNADINIVKSEPSNIDDYYVYENYQTVVDTVNNLNTLTITINESTGKNIYPTVKIYKK